MVAFPVEDERRYDIPEAEAFTPGEGRNVSVTVKVRTGVDSNGNGIYANETDFAPYSEWEFYLFNDRRDGGATQTARRNGAVAYRSEGSGITEGTPPAVAITLRSQDTQDMRTGDRWYELWVKISGEWSRVRYGIIPFKD